MEGAELIDTTSNAMDRLLHYLDSNLSTLHENLNQENFNTVLLVIWELISETLWDMVNSNLEVSLKTKVASSSRIIIFFGLCDTVWAYWGFFMRFVILCSEEPSLSFMQKRRPPSFYSNLHRTLHTLIRFFNLGADEAANVQVLEKIESLLKLHGLETAELIHRYNLERIREQKELEDPVYGLLTVRAQFIDNSMNIQILNARNLRPVDSNGKTFFLSFVKIILRIPNLSACKKNQSSISYPNKKTIFGNTKKETILLISKWVKKLNLCHRWGIEKKTRIQRFLK